MSFLEVSYNNLKLNEIKRTIVILEEHYQNRTNIPVKR